MAKHKSTIRSDDAQAQPLSAYRAKRDFAATSEPQGLEPPPPSDVPRFVVQMHDASHLHYDLRLEIDGVLASWAVPKGPSMDPADKRLAMPTEDHPMDYLYFEGVIPAGQYGAGPVLVWDTGVYVNLRADKSKPVSMAQSRQEGKIEVFLQGLKLVGAFALIRSGRDKSGRDRWLLIKMADDNAMPGSDIVTEKPASVVTGRDIDQVRSEG